MVTRATRVFCFLYETELTRNLCTFTTPAPIQNQIRSPSLRRSKPSEAAYSLYRKLSALNGNGSVDQVLNQWIQTDGRYVTGKDILVSVDYLSRFRKFHHALQLLEWTEKRGIVYLTSREHAKCIDLIWKTRGLEAAEEYFSDLPRPAKKKSTYGALLHCFCCEAMTDKAMTLFQKMKELNFPINSFDYCSLMCLHIKLGQPEKVPLLAQEMMQKGVKPHVFVYKLLINAYASLKDIKGVETVEEEINTQSGITPDWAFYSSLAAIYVDSGYFEKAESTLKEMEKLELQDPRAFHFLINLYTSLGRAEEVYRVWETLKTAFPKTNNLSYLTMLQALSRLEDMNGLNRCLEEWELVCSSYDVRLPNVLIKAYVKRDMIEKAMFFLDHILEKGCVPNFATYVLFIDFFIKGDQMDLARKFFKLGTPHVKNSESKMYQNIASIFRTTGL